MLMEGRPVQKPWALTAGVLKALLWGVRSGVGSGAEGGEIGGKRGRVVVMPRGIGSSACGLVYGIVGVCSFEDRRGEARRPMNLGGDMGLSVSRDEGRLDDNKCKSLLISDDKGLPSRI